MNESIYYQDSVKFRLYFRTASQEIIERDCCRKFYNTIYETEPNKPIHFYEQINGDRVSITKDTAHCYNVRYRLKGE